MICTLKQRFQRCKYPNLDHGKWVKNCTKNSGGTNRQTYGGESYWHMSDVCMKDWGFGSALF